MYVPDFTGRELPYAFLEYLKTRFTAAEIKADAPIEITYRTTTFSGILQTVWSSTKKRTVVCVYSTRYITNAETVPGASFYLIDAIPLELASILTDAEPPAMEKTLFGNSTRTGLVLSLRPSRNCTSTRELGKVVAKLYNKLKKLNCPPPCHWNISPSSKPSYGLVI